jgi:phenylpropionate dioxygenase-like ring-hydroxylating dioxygenase large terminal subunit
MLRKEQNDLLTQTGPETPMGAMFRSYWLPALLSEELPENDCPPVRVKLLSERLLAFRDSQGRYGLINEFCAHRGVSLWFGRNEEGGIRCPYHGWKYDVTGQCLEVPSEPSENGFCGRIRLKAYPLVEQGGVLWTYMGPPSQPGAGGAVLRLEAPAGMQLAAGHGRRDRFESRVLAASRQSQQRPAVQGCPGQQVQPERCEARIRSGALRGWPVHRRAS